MCKIRCGLGIAVATVLILVTALLVAHRPTHRPAASQPTTTAVTDERPGLDFQVPTPWTTNELVRLTVTTELDRLRLTEIELQPSGGVFVKNPVTPTTDSASSTSFMVRVSSTPSASVTAVAHVVDETGAAELIRRTIYLATDSGSVLSSTAGPTAVAEDVAARQRPDESTTQYTDQLDDLMLGGATTQASQAEPGHGSSLRVIGAAEYRASDGQPHPIRFAPVYLVPASSQSPIQVATTDELGHFDAVTSDTARGLCGACQLRVGARFQGMSVVDEATDDVYGIESSPLDLSADIGWRVALLANNVADNNTAFSVRDALVTSDLALETLVPGASAQFNVAYPTARMTSSYNPGGDHTLHVLRTDRFDWDVIGHEYAHYVEDRFGLTAGQEGPHVIGLGSAGKRGKQAGEELAWSEGFATWLAVGSQLMERAAELHIPNVGDGDYTDTEDVVPALSYSLATTTDPPGQGPDDELSVQRVLFALAFGDPAAGWPTLGVTRLMSVIVNERITSLAQLLSHVPSPAVGQGNQSLGCLPPTPDADSASNRDCQASSALLCVLARNQSGVTNVVLAGDSRGAPVTWQAGSVPPEALDAFRVVIYNQNWQPVEQSPRIHEARWQLAAPVAPGSHLVVIGWQTASPLTGPYGSCASEVQ